MTLRPILPVALLLTNLAALRAADPVPSGEFSRQQVETHFWAEGANVGDFNKDGKMDLVYGPYWWEGPDFTLSLIHI